MIKAGDFYISKKTASDEKIRQIAAVSGDVNPVHLDEKYAQKTIFGRRITHGLFCLNEISMILGNHLPGSGTILLSQEFNYIKPVYIGDEIQTKVSVDNIIAEKEIYELSMVCINQNENVVLYGRSKVKWKKLR